MAEVVGAIYLSIISFSNGHTFGGLFVLAFFTYVLLLLWTTLAVRAKLWAALALIAGMYAVWRATMFIGIRDPVVDTYCILAALVTAVLIQPSLRARCARLLRLRTDVPPLRITAVTLAWFTFLVSAWLFLSVADGLRKRSVLTRDPGRFERLRAANGNAEPSSRSSTGMRIGIALSGGGYRAAIYHAGVLDALEQRGIVVTHISSVSGGSIIGSFYAQGGAPRDLVDAIKSRRFMLAREIANISNFPRILHSWGIDWGKSAADDDFGRLEVQRELLDRVLLGGVAREHSWSPGLPHLMLCLTDLQNGDMIGVTPKGLLCRRLVPLVARERFANHPSQGNQNLVSQVWDPSSSAKLSDYVAGSGAFPGAFNPYKGYLADGGIVDNLGLRLLLDAHTQSVYRRWRTSPDETERQLAESHIAKQPIHWDFEGRELPSWELDVILASDAGAVIRGGAPDGSLEALFRAIDMMSLNSAPLAIGRREGAEPPDPPVILLSAGRIIQLVYDGGRQEVRVLHSDDFQPDPAVNEAELQSCLEAFVQTSTLEDRVPPERADKVFKLGQMMVRLHEKAIDAAIARGRVISPLDHVAREHGLVPISGWIALADGGTKTSWARPERGGTAIEATISRSGEQTVNVEMPYVPSGRTKLSDVVRDIYAKDPVLKGLVSAFAGVDIEHDFSTKLYAPRDTNFEHILERGFFGKRALDEAPNKLTYRGGRRFIAEWKLAQATLRLTLRYE